FWGCLLAVAITFPLVFGWIHFRTLPGDQLTYVTYLFGFPMGAFRLHTLTAWLLFHGLDISALLVLAGIALSLWRRMPDKGTRARRPPAPCVRAAASGSPRACTWRICAPCCRRWDSITPFRGPPGIGSNCARPVSARRSRPRSFASARGQPVAKLPTPPEEL